MVKLSLRKVNKYYSNGVHAIKNFNLEIENKEFIVIVGPSGSGKSTLLRLIAGLEKISDGEIIINDQISNHINPNERNTSMVFQNDTLFAHMTVAQNIAFGIKTKDNLNHQIYEVAKILEIESLLDRKPNEISGGQKQRVCIARALVNNPSVFLFDEPLSNLDTKLKTNLRIMIRKLYEQLNIPFIYVTHDLTEAMALATKIIVLNNGVIQQIASPLDIYHYPINQFVANFISPVPMNFICCKVNLTNEVLELDHHKHIILSQKYIKILKLKSYHNKSVILGCRPEYLIISDLNDYHMKGNIQIIETVGESSYIYLDNQICVKTTQNLNNEILYLKVDPNHIYLFDIDSTLSITNE